jgi:foldase protein PrsA
MPNRVLAGLAITVLGLGLSACSGGSSGGDVASVNGDKITRADFDKRLESGPQGKSVFNQMVQSLLIDQYAASNHISVSDADVEKKEDEIKSRFAPSQWDQTLKAQGLTEDDVHRILREQLVVQQAVSSNVVVTTADIQAYLDKNHATLDTPYQVHARHILVPDLKTALLVEAKLKGGMSFEDAAKQYSTDPSSKDKGGDLGFFGKGQMVPAFQAAAFSQKIGVIGPPVKSPFGFHIIEVLEKRPAQKATLANSSDKIKQILIQQKQQEQIPQFLASLRSKASIDIYDDSLKDALPPVPAAPPAGSAAPAAAASAAPAAASAAPAAASPAPAAASPAPAAASPGAAPSPG